MQEMAKGFSLLEEALLVFEARDHRNHEACAINVRFECNSSLPSISYR